MCIWYQQGSSLLGNGERRPKGNSTFYCTFKTELSIDAKLSIGRVLSQGTYIILQVLQSYEKDAVGAGWDGHSVSTGDGGERTSRECRRAGPAPALWKSATSKTKAIRKVKLRQLKKKSTLLVLNLAVQNRSLRCNNIHG